MMSFRESKKQFLSPGEKERADEPQQENEKTIKLSDVVESGTDSSGVGDQVIELVKYGQKGDEIVGVGEEQIVGSVRLEGDVNQEIIVSNLRSEKAWDPDVDGVVCTDSLQGEGILNETDSCSAGENNYTVDLNISGGLVKTEGRGVSSSSSNPSLCKNNVPFNRSQPPLLSRVNSSSPTPCTTSSHPSQPPTHGKEERTPKTSKYNEKQLQTKTTAGKISHFFSNPDSNLSECNITNVVVTVRPGDDENPTDSRYFPSKNTSNKQGIGHRSGLADSRESILSSPGLASFERTTGKNVVPPTPSTVDHSPFQPAAGSLPKHLADTRSADLESNICGRLDSQIADNSDSPVQRLTPECETSDNEISTVRFRDSEQKDNSNSISEYENRNGGSQSSIQDYSSSSSSNVCGKKCHLSPLCLNISSDCCGNRNETDGVLINKQREVPFKQGQCFPVKQHISEQLKRSSPTLAVIPGHSIVAQDNTTRVHPTANVITEGSVQSEPNLSQVITHDSECNQLGGYIQKTNNSATFTPSSWTVPRRFPLVNRPSKSRISYAVSSSANSPKNVDSNKQPIVVSKANRNDTVVNDKSIDAKDNKKQISNVHSNYVGVANYSYSPSLSSRGYSDVTPESQRHSSASLPKESRSQSSSLNGSPSDNTPAFVDLSLISHDKRQRNSSDSSQISIANACSNDNIRSQFVTKNVSDERLPDQQNYLSHDRSSLHFKHRRSVDSALDPKHSSVRKSSKTEQYSNRKTGKKYNRTRSTGSAEWPDADYLNNQCSGNIHGQTSHVDCLDDSSEATSFLHHRSSLNKKQERRILNLGSGSERSHENGRSNKEHSSDDGGCEATSALLLAQDSDDDFVVGRKVDDVENSGDKRNDDHERTALVYKQKLHDSTKEIREKSLYGRKHFSRLVRFYRKDLLRGKNNSNCSTKASLTSSSEGAPAFSRQSHSENLQQCTSTPVIHITTTTTKSSATSGLGLGGNTTATTGGTSKPKVSFISGLRRLSKEKTAFSRVDQADLTNYQVTSSPISSLQDNLDEVETGKIGRRFGAGDRRKLKVEFAVMEGEGEKYARGRGRGFGGGSYSGGIQSVKDDVENDVAMLGGVGARFRQPRVSLLGKPLNYRAHRRDIKYRRLQARIYNFLERPKSWGSWIYHLAVFLFVLLCLTLGVLSSISEFENILIQYAVYLEIVMLLWIMIELGLRVWSAGCRSRYQGKSGRLRFIRRPLCIIDIILTLASISTLVVGSTQEHFPQAVLSGLRFFQILRMVRMDRKGGTWKLLGSVVWAHRQELITTLYIGLLGLIFSSYFVYLAEKDEPRHDSEALQHFNHSDLKPKFSNFADAIWWGVVTLCTVGYGDVVPATWGGKVIASFSAILGISFFALPAGILGSGFALKVQQQQRQKHLNRRRVPAANLIQCLWRCYAADEHSMSTATWKRHMIPCPSPTSERTFKNNTSFVSRFSTRRRDRSSTAGSLTSRDGIGTQAQSPMTNRQGSRRAAISTSEEEVPNVLDRSHLSLATGLAEQKLQLDTLPFKKENSVSSIGKDSEDEPDLSPRLTQLTDQHKRAIRALRKIRYFVARRKFREALRPYDVKDVIEQYSAGHVDMLGRIKNLQGRLDQILGRQGSKSKDVYESKICLASRIVKVERQVEDIESKLDLLVDMYQEDRKLIMQQMQQTCGGVTQGGSPHPPPPPAPSSQFKPRPILIDKQFTSEPATPTGLGFVMSPDGRQQGMKPVIQRNLSDLSQRIKKRVTYRGLSLHDPPSRAQSAANFSSSLPSASFLQSALRKDSTSPDEFSSKTISGTTKDDSSVNLISLSDINHPLTLVTNTLTGYSNQDNNTLCQDVLPISAVSFPVPDDMFSLDANFSCCTKGSQHQQQLPPITPVSINSVAGKMLSTLNEQRSMESDTSLSCLDTYSPPPPDIRDDDVFNHPYTTSPNSMQQTPMSPRVKKFNKTEKTPLDRTNSGNSSKSTERRHKPILRLPSNTASSPSPQQSSTMTGQSFDKSLSQTAVPPSSFPSNHINSINNFIIQAGESPKVCDKHFELPQDVNDELSGHNYTTSDF